MTRQIGFLIYPGFQLLDLTGPLDAFHMARRMSGSEPYKIRVVSPTGGLIGSSSGLEVMSQQVGRKPFDTFFVVGGGVLSACSDPPSQLANLARIAGRDARRVASVCTGAFILAHAGLLDGKNVTTHWKYAALLQRLFPRVRVDGDRIFVKDGNTWTSAGISAGVDLALALIEEDLGPSIARATAQMLVVYHRRPGGQSQFSALLEMEPESDRIRTVLTYIREHLPETLSVERLSEVACLSPRQFGRAFLSETGETPAKAVERLRTEVARERVENGNEPLEVIARNVGFVDPERMRRAFLRIFGHPPQSIRRMTARNAQANASRGWKALAQVNFPEI